MVTSSPLETQNMFALFYICESMPGNTISSVGAEEFADEY